MALRVRIKDGGTGAGSKQPLRDQPKPWTCASCGNNNKGWHARCMRQGCNLPRPL